MTLESWLTKHPYLRPVAEFHAQVAAAMNSIPVAYAQIPDWQQYLEDYKTGLPVLASSPGLVDPGRLQRSLGLLLEKLTSMTLPEKIYPQILDLSAEFQHDLFTSKRVTAWLLDRQDVTLPHPGLLRYFGWTILASYLRPLITAFENWRDEEAWLHPYCPICGSGPSMAQLARTEPARRRMLVCGNCGARRPVIEISSRGCIETDDCEPCVMAEHGEWQIRIDQRNACNE